MHNPTNAGHLTIDKDMLYLIKKMIEQIKAIKRVLAYVKCVRETGGDWANPDCMFPKRKIEIPEGYDYQEEIPLLEELLAQMPEDEQRQVATSITNAQVGLIEQYTTEVEKLSGMFR